MLHRKARAGSELPCLNLKVNNNWELKININKESSLLASLSRLKPLSMVRMEDLDSIHHSSDLFGILIAQVKPEVFLHSKD